MALERIGLGGVLTFDSSQAVRSTGQARDAMGRFIRQVDASAPPMQRMAQRLRNIAQQAGATARRVGQGMNTMIGGLRNAGVAALPLTLAMGAGVAQAANFEQQMSGVAAITNANAEDMARLTERARHMGIVSVFSATQSGEAMELMARAGATTDQIIDGLGGVMNAASAEGLDLATATDIVAQSTRIMGREWGQAANTADILTRASQRGNTDMRQLGEAMRYGGLVARSAGLDMEETAAILTRLADAGLQGSTGGTSMVNALNKLANPSRRGAARLQELGIQMTRTASGGVDFVNIMEQLGNATSGIEDPLERIAIATDIFGVRGARAFNALAQAGEESVDSLVGELRRASEGVGAAAEASNRRLNNFKGALTLLMSSLEGVAITLFGPLLEPMKEFLQNVTENLNAILTGVQSLMGAGDDVEARYSALSQIFEENGDTMANIILGVTDALQDMQDAFNWIKETISEVMGQMEGAFGGDTVRTITRFGILFAIAAAAIAPVLIGLGAVAFVVGTVLIPVIKGAAVVLGAIFWPVVVVLGVLTAAFFLIRREGETFGETMTRIWNVIKYAIQLVWDEALQPLWNGITSVIQPAIETLGQIWSDIIDNVKQIINDLADEFFGASEGMSVDFEEVGRVIGAVIAAAAEVFSRFVQFIVPIIGFVITALFRLGRAIFNNIIETFGGVFSAIGRVYRGFQTLFSGDILDGLAEIGQGLLDLILEPLKSITRQVIGLADAIGGESLVPQSVRDWARATEAPSAVRRRGRAQRGEGGGAGIWDALFGEGEVPTRPQADETSAGRLELEALGQQVSARQARSARRRAAPGAVEANIELQDEREINMENNLCVDGSNMAVATERHRQEIGERAGFRATPWQRRVRIEQGAAPVTGGGG